MCSRLMGGVKARNLDKCDPKNQGNPDPDAKVDSGWISGIKLNKT